MKKTAKYTRKNIITLPNEHLREKSKKIREISDGTLQLIQNMKDAMLDWEDSRPHEMAVALAAVQIDALERVVIIREDLEDKSNKNYTVLINPEIIKGEGKMIVDQEGCLSVKDIYGAVPRYEKVRVKALDINGNEVRIKAKDPFISRVLQHEIDHCNGICFVDHITHDKNAFSILDKEGNLVPIAYEEVQKMGILDN